MEDRQGNYRPYTSRKRPHYLEDKDQKGPQKRKNQHRADLLRGERLDKNRTGGPFNHFFDPEPLEDHAGYRNNQNHPWNPRNINPWYQGTLSDHEHQEEEEHYPTATVEDSQSFFLSGILRRLSKKESYFRSIAQSIHHILIEEQ